MPPARTLASPVTLGALALPHRVLMAPMTRNRATPDGLATDDCTPSHDLPDGSAP